MSPQTFIKKPNADMTTEAPTNAEDLEWESPRMQPRAGRVTVSGLGRPSVEVTVNNKGVVSPATIPMKKEK